MTDVTTLLGAASGPALFVVALVVIVKVLWSDRRAEKLVDTVIRGLQLDVANLRTELAWEQDRRLTLEGVMSSSGIALPPARPRPVPLTPDTADHH